MRDGGSHGVRHARVHRVGCVSRVRQMGWVTKGAPCWVRNSGCVIQGCTVWGASPKERHTGASYRGALCGGVHMGALHGVRLKGMSNGVCHTGVHRVGCITQVHHAGVHRIGCIPRSASHLVHHMGCITRGASHEGTTHEEHDALCPVQIWFVLNVAFLRNFGLALREARVVRVDACQVKSAHNEPGNQYSLSHTGEK